MMDWMKQQDDETDYEWVTDMASLLLTIFFCGADLYWFSDCVGDAEMTESEIFAIENNIPDSVITDRDWTIHFANAIIRAHEAKLIEGVGEPFMVLEDIGWEFPEGTDPEWLTTLPIGTKTYLESQVAAAIAKAEANSEAVIKNLHTVMMAAAVEITEHWDAHCDEEGYGPANLVRRLENCYPAQYGYDAQTVVHMEKRITTLESTLKNALWTLEILGHTRYSVEEAADTADVVIHQIKGVLNV